MLISTYFHEYAWRSGPVRRKDRRVAFTAMPRGAHHSLSIYLSILHLAIYPSIQIYIYIYIRARMNAHQFAEWIVALHSQPCHVVRTNMYIHMYLSIYLSIYRCTHFFLFKSTHVRRMDRRPALTAMPRGAHHSLSIYPSIYILIYPYVCWNK